MMTWETLEQVCRGCGRCALGETRTNTVFGVGPVDAEVMFVGEGPGQQEDLRGEPFVGPAGQLLEWDAWRLIPLEKEAEEYLQENTPSTPHAEPLSAYRRLKALFLLRSAPF